MKLLSEDERRAMEARVYDLRTMHRDLDGAIDALAEKGSHDNLRIQRLKKQKLQLKDQIAQIESALLPDIIA